MAQQMAATGKRPRRRQAAIAEIRIVSTMVRVPLLQPITYLIKSLILADMSS